MAVIAPTEQQLNGAKRLPASKPDYIIRSSTPFTPHRPTAPSAWEKQSESIPRSSKDDRNQHRDG